MVEQDILYHGVAPDEALSAYKDIEAVMRLQSDLVCPIAEMVPLVTIMGGGEQYSNFDRR
jgi:RNA-splicing ligase RtcB